MTVTLDLPENTSVDPNADYLRLVTPDAAGAVNGKEYKVLINSLLFYNSISFLQLFPGLRGLWPMSAIDSSGNAQDVSGQAHHLTYNGNPTYNVAALAPYIALDGTGDYLSRTDEADLDILGTESYVAIPGLTLGGWFYFDNAAGSSEFLILKRTGGGTEKSYGVSRQSDGTVQGSVSNDGSAVTTVGSTSTTSSGTWYFVVVRFDPSTELAIWLDAEKTTNTTSIPASIYNSTTDFTIGATATGSVLLTGRASLCFLCAAAVPDTIIDNFYNYSRGLFS